jgi:hypothetical protein
MEPVQDFNHMRDHAQNRFFSKHVFLVSGKHGADPVSHNALKALQQKGFTVQRKSSFF